VAPPDDRVGLSFLFYLSKTQPRSRPDTHLTFPCGRKCFCTGPCLTRLSEPSSPPLLPYAFNPKKLDCSPFAPPAPLVARRRCSGHLFTKRRGFFSLCDTSYLCGPLVPLPPTGTMFRGGRRHCRGTKSRPLFFSFRRAIVRTLYCHHLPSPRPGMVCCVLASTNQALR